MVKSRLPQPVSQNRGIMEDLSKDYIYLDGMWLKETQLLQLAKNAGSYSVAEHYLMAYLANAVINGYREAVNKVNEVRASYGVKPIPVPDGKDGHQSKNTADQARMKYIKMPLEKQKTVLLNALTIIMNQHLKLFKSRIFWNGIYLVVRDRVDSGIKKTEFSRLAASITPDGWPQSLTISKSTLNNYSHYPDVKDQDRAYFNMGNNPWKDLCDMFWELLERQILTND